MTLAQQIRELDPISAQTTLAEAIDALAGAGGQEHSVDDEIELLSLEQLAEQLNTTSNWLNRQITKHKIPTVTAPSGRFVRKTEWLAGLKKIEK